MWPFAVPGLLYFDPEVPFYPRWIAALQCSWFLGPFDMILILPVAFLGSMTCSRILAWYWCFFSTKASHMHCLDRHFPQLMQSLQIWTVFCLKERQIENLSEKSLSQFWIWLLWLRSWAVETRDARSLQFKKAETNSHRHVNLEQRVLQNSFCKPGGWLTLQSLGSQDIMTKWRSVQVSLSLFQL